MFGDCHIHMILDGIYYRAAIDAQKDHPDDQLIRARLAAYRDAGITFLRDGGDAWGVGSYAARIAGEYGIDYRTPVFPIYKRGHYGSFIGCGFDTMREYADLVRQAAERGADFIKIMISGLMDFDCYGCITGDPLTESEIREMIRIAHDSGFCVMAHANGADVVKVTVNAGVDSIEHGAYLDDSAIDDLAHSDCTWVPTLVTIGNLISCGRYPDSVLQPLLAFQQANVRKCASLGGRIALGSDNGAYRVLHAQGTLDEYGYLRAALGDACDAVLRRGEDAIREKFKRG